MSELLTVRTVDDDRPADYVRRHATVLHEFGPRSQDSGNVSWLVATPSGRLFVKTAGLPGPPAPDAPVPYLDHEGRVGRLRNAVVLARSCRHPALPPLRNVIESPAGPLLVYDAVPGELVGVPVERRREPGSAYQRFAHLPAPDLLRSFDTLVDLHRVLADAGWVAVDLYDGCLLVDFGAARLSVVDLDNYRRGPSTNEMGRMFGSTRFMAPEEQELGAAIDERTTVFTLGRLAWHFSTRLTERPGEFCGTPAVAQVLQRACRPDPADRYPCVAALAEAWDDARAAG